MLHIPPTVLYILIAVLVLVIIFKSIKKGLALFSKLFVFIRRFIGTLLEGIIIFLQRLKRKLLSGLSNETDRYLDELTPSANADDDKVYDEQLKWAFDNKNVKNIAITGPFGSGKSSIIKTFQERHKEYKYLNLSLASFKENNAHQNAEPINEQLIEYSILQQIILHIRQSKLPGSRFHRIRHQSKMLTVLNAVTFFLFCLSIIYLFNKSTYDDILGFKNLSIEDLIARIILFLGAIRLIYVAFKAYANSIISKFKFTNAEIELSPKDASVLNKQIEEILYFFQATSFEIVIIEDLDRFNDPSIFTKLREINTLINNAEQIKRKIVFVYVLGDDMFKVEKRTKFFDFIMPVIPVVNTFNSHQLLIDRLESFGLSNIIHEDFLNEVSLYINDMRLLKNVMNEFHLYRKKLKNEEKNLNDTNLLALVIYKNIYPDDFALMHINKGMVVAVFDKREQFVKSELIRIKGENEELNKKIKLIEDVIPNKVQELRLVYLTKWMSMLGNNVAVSVQIESQNYTVDQMLEDSLFKKIKTLSRFTYQHYSRSYNGYLQTSTSSVTFSTAVKEIDPTMSYEEKEEIVRNKQSNKIDQLRNDFEKNNLGLQKIQESTIAALLEKDNEGKLYEPIKDHRLLIYLLRNGYINEEYQYYISYFYKGSLQNSDLNFILNVKDRKPTAFNHKLSNIEGVVKKMQYRDFERPEILNIDLAQYLLENKEKNKNYLMPFMEILSTEEETAINFINDFFSIGKAIKQFTIELSNKWSNWWNYTFESSTYSDKEKNNFFELLLAYADLEDLKKQNTKNYISKYLAKVRDFSFFRMHSVSDEKLCNILLNLDVKIETLEESTISNLVVDYIYDNNLYTFNEEIITFFIQRKLSSKVELTKNLREKPYSILEDPALSKMMKYVDANIDLYTKEFVLELPGNIFEDESAMFILLEGEGLSFESKYEIIEKYGTQFTKFPEENKELWSIILENEKIQCNWENILLYYQQTEKIDDSLAEYLNNNQNAETLESKKMPEGQMSENISKEIIISKEISDQVVIALLNSIPFEFNDFPISDLNYTRIASLLDKSILSLSQSNFNALKSISKEFSIRLIISKMNEFLENNFNISLNPDDYIQIFKSGELEKWQQSSLIEKIEEEFYNDANSLATIVSKILSNTDINLPFERLIKILSSSFDQAASLKIINEKLQDWDGEKIEKALLALGDKYAEITINGKKPLLEDKRGNEILAKKLKEAGYISSYSISDEGIRIYTFKSGDEQVE